MTKHRDLNYNDRLPEAVMDALMEFISTHAENFVVSLFNTTTLQVVAGVSNDQACIGINGRWRYNSATVNAAHPGGAAGTYDVYVTATDNSFVPSGNPPGMSPENDLTVYSFGLAIRAAGSPPATALYRKVATCLWDGVAITKITHLVGGPKADVLWSGVGLDISYTSGKVGIGTITPAGFFHVVSDGSFSSEIVERDSADASGVQLRFRKGRGTPAAPANVTNNDTILDLRAEPYSGGFLAQSFARVEVDAAVVGGQQPATRLIFYTNLANGAAVERLRIASDGAITADGTFRAGSGGNAFRAVTVAGSRSFESYLLLADANAAHYVLGDGKHWWGAGGATAVDTNLYRAGIDRLATDDQLEVSGEIRGSTYVRANMGLASEVLIGQANGARISGFSFASGAGTGYDTYLYRNSAGVLRTDGEFQIGGLLTLTGNGFSILNRNMDVVARLGLRFATNNDANDRFNIGADGKIQWGAGGATAVDTSLSRYAAGILETGGGFQTRGYLDLYHASAVDTAGFSLRSFTDGGGAHTEVGEIGLLEDGNATRKGKFVILLHDGANLRTPYTLYSSGRITALHATTNNIAFDFDPSGGGAGSPRFTMKSSAGVNAVMLEPYPGGLVLNDSAGAIKNALVSDASNRLLIGLGWAEGRFDTSTLLTKNDGTTAMRVHRHPYANERHVESGSGTLTTGALSVSFSDAFAAAPVVVATPASNDLIAAVTAVSTTGATINVHTTAAANGTGTVYWHAEGRDT